jgi:hypothetical protein
MAIVITRSAVAHRMFLARGKDDFAILAVFREMLA